MTNAVIETLMTRRSVRAFQEKQFQQISYKRSWKQPASLQAVWVVRPGNSPLLPIVRKSRN